MGRKIGRWLFLSPILLILVGAIIGLIYLISMFTGFNPLASLFANINSMWPIINITISIVFPSFVVGLLILATTPGVNAPVFTVKGSIRQGWTLSKSAILTFILVFLFFIAVQGGLFLVSLIVPIIINILMGLVGVWMLLAYLNLSLLRAKQLPIQFKNIFISPKKIIYFLIANSISFLFISLGLLLFVIPGIRWSLRLSMVPFCILEKNIGPMAAIKSSRKMTKGFVPDLFLSLIMGGLILMLGSMLLGIGLIWAIPTYLVAQAYIYTKINTKYMSENIAPVIQEIT